mmetsp:Transcript_5687/g.20671  ORF Transcript_5687/g.20671 Transcript_5687/m.20671 type:complete len:234 (+) Transcript_5687:288-989(+)
MRRAGDLGGLGGGRRRRRSRSVLFAGGESVPPPTLRVASSIQKHPRVRVPSLRGRGGVSSLGREARGRARVLREPDERALRRLQRRLLGRRRALRQRRRFFRRRRPRRVQTRRVRGEPAVRLRGHGRHGGRDGARADARGRGRAAADLRGLRSRMERRAVLGEADVVDVHSVPIRRRRERARVPRRRRAPKEREGRASRERVRLRGVHLAVREGGGVGRREARRRGGGEANGE